MPLERKHTLKNTLTGLLTALATMYSIKVSAQGMLDGIPSKPGQTIILTPQTPSQPTLKQKPSAPNNTGMLGDENENIVFPKDLQTGVTTLEHNHVLAEMQKIPDFLLPESAKLLKNLFLSANPKFQDGFEMIIWNENGVMKSGWYKQGTYNGFAVKTYEPNKTKVSVFFNEGTKTNLKPNIRTLR